MSFWVSPQLKNQVKFKEEEKGLEMLRDTGHVTQDGSHMHLHQAVEESRSTHFMVWV